ncbi:hypothetical protein IB642_00195 [Allofrancisella guangzhouensis]|uniref:hypothetical protein n=1 Tax=Allofrancisella guangzhouensis TaxID=594679 RepID=UPI000A66B131|nr:hypothetical protein [Allofrancisella guangzhouensis]MBK2027378.1 hypothetical protein [Allofrancisella guangzhouensis]MBK2043437.1 hypothetical protein [Allofrancisella guangzhouensis]MBK2045206.1 hypothetical protein [Allofrancisella guangzhouensis]
MKNITLTKLRKELKFRSREDLQADIELLFKQFPQVKNTIPCYMTVAALMRL